jgi:hypothetical protein
MPEVIEYSMSKAKSESDDRTNVESSKATWRLYPASFLDKRKREQVMMFASFFMYNHLLDT